MALGPYSDNNRHNVPEGTQTKKLCHARKNLFTGSFCRFVKPTIIPTAFYYVSVMTLCFWFSKETGTLYPLFPSLTSGFSLSNLSKIFLISILISSTARDGTLGFFSAKYRAIGISLSPSPVSSYNLASR